MQTNVLMNSHVVLVEHTYTQEFPCRACRTYLYTDVIVLLQGKLSSSDDLDYILKEAEAVAIKHLEDENEIKELRKALAAEDYERFF